MDERFLTNRNTILFYTALSVVVVPFGIANLYRAVSDTGAYAIGWKSVIAPLLPVLTLLAWRQGRLAVRADGVMAGRAFYPAATHRFALRTERRALKDRPLTSLWRRDYDTLDIAKAGGGPVATIALEMSRADVARLGRAITTLAPR